MSRRVTVRALIIKDNTVFSVRHRHRGGSENNFWCTPGGGLDLGESLLKGITREIIEETGVTPQIGRLLIIQQYHLPTPYHDTNYTEGLEFFFHVENPGDFESIDLSTTTHGADEIAEFGFVDPRSVDYLPKVLKTLDLQDLLTKNSPVVITDELSES